MKGLDNIDEKLADPHESEAGFKLRYPLENWIEELLSKYPTELSGILPKERLGKSSSRDKSKKSPTYSKYTDAA